MTLRYLVQRQDDVTMHSDAWLAPVEREVLLGLHVDKRRADWLLGRWTAKRALSRPPEAIVGNDPREWARVAIVAAADGAPEVLVDERPADLAVSISHSSGHALCVTAPADTAVGCDLEEVAPRSHGFVDTFFTEDEQAAVVAASDSAAGASGLIATLIWSAKECVLKALRVGLREDTRGVAVTLPAPDATGSVWHRFDAWHRGTGRTFNGWWREHDRLVLTIVSAPPSAMPEHL